MVDFKSSLKSMQKYKAINYPVFLLAIYSGVYFFVPRPYIPMPIQ